MTSPSTRSKIYTKTGDKGKTRLVGGECVDKFNPRVEAYGTTDELNSYLGLVRIHLQKKTQFAALDRYLEVIQNEMFNLGSRLACEDAKIMQSLPPVTEASISKMENQIDEMDSQLPRLNQFILPGGSEVSAHFHLARTLCRRSERRTAEIHHLDPRYQLEMIYLNRLSDFLFVAARWVNHQLGQADTVWNKNL